MNTKSAAGSGTSAVLFFRSFFQHGLSFAAPAANLLFNDLGDQAIRLRMDTRQKGLLWGIVVGMFSLFLTVA